MYERHVKFTEGHRFDFHLCRRLINNSKARPTTRAKSARLRARCARIQVQTIRPRTPVQIARDSFVAPPARDRASPPRLSNRRSRPAHRCTPERQILADERSEERRVGKESR